MKTVTACKCLISPEYVKTLLESAKFHEILVLKAPISCEIPWLKVPNFRWISVIGSTHFHMRIWISLIGSVRFHMNIWNSLIGSAKFHMNFNVWKCQISYKFPCLDVRNFISNCQISYEFLIWKCKCSSTFLIWKCPISYEHLKFPDWKRQISYEFPCLEVPNFIWISLLGRANFHFKLPNFIWISLFGSAKFHTNFHPWKFSNFIWTFEIPWLEGLNFIWIFLFASTQFQMNQWNCQI